MDKYTILDFFWRQVYRGIQEKHREVRIDIIKDVYDKIVVPRHMNISVSECKSIIKDALSSRLVPRESQWIDDYAVVVKPSDNERFVDNDFGLQLEVRLSERLDPKLFDLGYDPMHSELVIKSLTELEDHSFYTDWQISVFLHNDGQYAVAFDDWLGGSAHRPVILHNEELTVMQTLLNLIHITIEEIKRGNK